MKASDWDIWSNYFASISQGKPLFGIMDEKLRDELERNIALGSTDGKFNKEFWKREPALINADIKAWVDYARATDTFGKLSSAIAEPDMPKQSSDASSFGLNANGQVDRLPTSPENRLQITPILQQEYAALLEDAKKLAGHGQMLGKLGPELSNLLTAMPEDMSQAEVFSLWRAINRLRRTMNAHLAVARDIEPHEAKLERSIAEELAALLDSANNLAFTDLGMRKRDENTVPPQDRPSVDEERKLGDDLEKSIINTPEILTQQARDVVKAEAENAKGAGSDQHSAQAVDQANKTRRNVVAALLSVLKGETSFAWKEFRGGAYKAAGAGAATVALTDLNGTTTVYPTILRFIIENAEKLSIYAEKVYHNPALAEFLSKLAQHLSSLT